MRAHDPRSRSDLAEDTAEMVYAGPGPKSGGKLLDGVDWCEFPASSVAVPA